MHTVEYYKLARELAEALGYHIREENLGGVGGGACEVAGRKCLFVDIAMTRPEQLEQVLKAVEADPLLSTQSIPTALFDVWPERRAVA